MNRHMIRLVLGLLFGIAILFAQQQQQQKQGQAQGQQQPQQKGPAPKSQKEVDALMAIQNAQNPDARIAAVDSLLADFADTDFKAWALQMAVTSAQQKGDYEKTLIYGERSLQADPKSYSVMLILAETIANKTREFDLDREEKLAKVEKYVQQANDLIKDAVKPRPDITDEQWAGFKKDLTAQAHEALAMAAVARKKYDVAITEYKTSIDTASQPDPATMVRLGATYTDSGKPDDAIAILNKVLAMPNLHPQIKSVAEAEKKRAQAVKAAPVKPAQAPSSPAEVKKP